MSLEPKAIRSMTRLTQLRLQAANAARVSSGLVNASAVSKCPLTIVAVSGQTGSLLEIQDSAGVVLAKYNAAGQLVLTAAASLADPFGLGGQLKMARAKYSFAVDGGAVGAITPATTAILPNNAIVVAAIINPTTAVVGTTSTLAVGTTAGSSASSIKTATAEATLSLNAVLNGSVTFAAPFKMTAAGSINVTVAVNVLTAGVVEITVFYFTAAA